MKEQWERTARLIGWGGIEWLRQAKVAVFGLGGVGGSCAEALARSGIGELWIVDRDVVSPSNLNRQIIATTDTVGRKKTEVMAERLRAVAPECHVKTFDLFFLPPEDPVLTAALDYVVDAVDTVTAKLFLAEECQRLGLPLISSMGTGNRMDPSQLQVTDLFLTKGCPLAKVMRRECKKRGIHHLPVVFSTEAPIPNAFVPEQEGHSPGSSPFVPAAAGLLLASAVVKNLLEVKNHGRKRNCNGTKG